MSNSQPGQPSPRHAPSPEQTSPDLSQTYGATSSTTSPSTRCHRRLEAAVPARQRTITSRGIRHGVLEGVAARVQTQLRSPNADFGRVSGGASYCAKEGQEK